MSFVNARTPARAALWLLALFVLLCLTSIPAARAAQEDVDEAVGLLAAMQGSDVNPEWPPDIEANAARVQAMLDAFTRCTPAERAAFTDEQLTDLRAFFEALYSVQGRDPAEVDALFTGGAQSGSSSPSPASSSQSEGPDSSEPAASSEPVESSSQPPASQSQGNLPSASGAVPGAGNPPQVSGGSGLSAFFGGGGLAVLLIIVLAALAILVFFRFLAAQRTAKKEAVALAPADATGEPESDSGPVLPFVLNQPEVKETHRQARRRLRREEKAARRAQKREEDAPPGAPAQSDDHLWASTPEEESVWSDPLASAAARNGDSVHTGLVIEDPALDEEGGETLRNIAPPRELPADTKPAEKPPARSRRTGKPARMPFRVGPEHDLDGIDD